jgi:hypothetical protein
LFVIILANAWRKINRTKKKIVFPITLSSRNVLFVEKIFLNLIIIELFSIELLKDGQAVGIWRSA